MIHNIISWSMGMTLALLLPIASAPAPAQAQDSAAAGQETSLAAPMDQASARLTTIDRNQAELVRLIGEIPASEGEDRVLLRSRIDDLITAQHADLLTLVRRIQTEKGLGGRLGLLEQRTERALQRLSRLLRDYLEKLQSDRAYRAAERPELAGSELQVFEHELAGANDRIDRHFLTLIELTDVMMAFGLSVDQEQDFLQRRLTDRGQMLLQRLELAGQQLEEHRGLLKGSPDDSELQARVYAAEESFDTNKTSLLTTIHMLKTLGLDFTDLEVRTLEITGEIAPEALEIKVALGLFERALERTRTYLVDNGPRLLILLLTILGILLVFWVAARLVRRMTGKILDRTRFSSSKLLKEMVISLAGRFVLAIGLIVVLSQLGINLGPILAGLGIVGFIVGFALQDTLSNFAAGAMILAYQPFDVGDLIEAAGVTGKVRDMNLVSTRILTVDHQTLIVPNSKIWGDVIRNVTAQPIRRIDMVFGISYEDEIPKAERVLKEIVEAHDRVLADPQPVIKVHTLNDSSVDFVVRPWAATEDYWEVYWDITREVKLRFDHEGISIPYPQRDVHLIEQGSQEQS